MKAWLPVVAVAVGAAIEISFPSLAQGFSSLVGYAWGLSLWGVVIAGLIFTVISARARELDWPQWAAAAAILAAFALALHPFSFAHGMKDVTEQADD